MGTATSWDPNASSTVRTFALTNSTLYTGGSFVSICRVRRPSLAALDAVTGIATAWNPSPNSNVLALAIEGSTLYVGGCFSAVGGQTRNHLAALDAITGSATAWNPTANGNCIHALALAGPTLYAGGEFTFIGGQARTNVVALDAATGNATAWNPGANGIVRAIAATGSTVWLGGDFLDVAGQAHSYIAALNSATGAATVAGGANGPVYGLDAQGSVVYAAGGFTSVFGQARNYIAALDAVSGVPTGWSPNLSGTAYAVAANGLLVYAGGDFSSHIAEISTVTGSISATDYSGNPWFGADDAVRSILPSGSTVYIGGDFLSIWGASRPRLAAITVPFAPPCDDAIPSCNAVIPSASWGTCGTTIGTTGQLAYPATIPDGAGGAFIGWNEPVQRTTYLSRLNADGSLASGWPPNMPVSSDSAGSALVAPDGAGGVFVGWTRYGAAGPTVHCQRYNGSAGVAPGWPANGITIPGLQYPGQMVADGNGGAFFFGDRTQHLDSTGSIASGWPPLGLPPEQYDAVADGTGGFFGADDYKVRRVSATAAVSWEANLAGAARLCADATGGLFVVQLSSGIRVHHLQSSGAPVLGWPAAGMLLTSVGTLRDVKPDGQGGVLVCWTETAPAQKFVVQRLTACAEVAPGWPATGFRIGTFVPPQPTTAAVAPDGSGGAYLVWQGRTGSGPVSYWATRVCPGGQVSADWPAGGIEVCPNIRYVGGAVSLVADGAGGAFGSWYRRTAATGWGGSVHVMRLGSVPPAGMIAPVIAGSPSSASVGNMSVVFDNVTAAGELSLDLTTGPLPPAGQQTVPVAAPATYELDTTASYTGGVDVCIDYNPDDVIGSEAALSLLHYEGEEGAPAWVNITTSVDVVEHRICGRAPHLSPFIIVEGIVTDASLPVAVLALQQNHPNPFNPTTTIRYSSPQKGRVRLRIFDVRGRLVRTLVDRDEAAGAHEAVWFGDDQHGQKVGSGVYFYRLDAGGEPRTRRMVLVR